MLTTRVVTTYGFISIGIMLVLLLLVWFKAVPQWMYIPLFLVAFALFIVRIVLRFMLMRQEREAKKSDKPNP